MNCPACKEPALVMSERKGIEIDYCPKCRGIWLDRGELDKILERSKREDEGDATTARREPEQYPSEYLQQRYDSDHHKRPQHYKRRKSFLEELFD